MVEGETALIDGIKKYIGCLNLELQSPHFIEIYNKHN